MLSVLCVFTAASSSSSCCWVHFLFSWLPSQSAESVIQKFDSHHKVGRATEMEKGTTSGAGAAAAKAKDAKTLSQEFAERVGSMERDEREKFMGLMSLMTDIAKQA